MLSKTGMQPKPIERASFPSPASDRATASRRAILEVGCRQRVDRSRSARRSRRLPEAVVESRMRRLASVVETAGTREACASSDVNAQPFAPPPARAHLNRSSGAIARTGSRSRSALQPPLRVLMPVRGAKIWNESCTYLQKSAGIWPVLEWISSADFAERDKAPQHPFSDLELMRLATTYDDPDCDALRHRGDGATATATILHFGNGRVDASRSLHFGPLAGVHSQLADANSGSLLELLH